MTLIAALLSAPFALLTFCFAVEVFVGLRPLRQIPMPMARGIRAVIVVPAHDEETILKARLQALKEAGSGKYPILLVADNCTDATAEIGRGLGVEVVERFDSARRGKGFALDFARSHLRKTPPDVIVIVDADCAIDEGSLDTLVARCAAVSSPCQATNLQKPAPEGSAAVQVSTFAFFIKNVIRQRAVQRLAGRAHLLGTGMALPWSIFERANLATSDIVEDLRLGQDLAEAGHAPTFVEEATVWSDAETEKNTLSQRSRWEGGFLQNALRSGPVLFARSLSKGDVPGLWAALNLIIPPIALLILLDLLALMSGAMIVGLSGAQEWPVLLLGGSIVLAGIALALAWGAGGSHFVSPGALVRIPLYLLWKLPMYLGFARRGTPNGWIRTRREEK